MQSPDHKSPITNHKSLLLADCHLHFEGSLPPDVLQALARRAAHPFADLEVFEARRQDIRDDAGFLSLYAEICRLFRRPEDYGDAARAIGESLARDGVGYAEIYVSPAILSRMALDGASCLQAIDAAFRARPGGCDCRILLDVVRQWGPESAERVLDLHERNPLPSVLGFGMGGDEKAMPAAAFAGVYMRARALGLKTSVHAGEWAGPDSLEQALDVLRPDRVDHGIAAAADARLAERLADERTTPCVAPTGNVATEPRRVSTSILCRVLIEAGVRVALRPTTRSSSSTTTANEFQVRAIGSASKTRCFTARGERLARRLLLAAGTEKPSSQPSPGWKPQPVSTS